MESYYNDIKKLNIEHYAGEISYYSKAELRKVEVFFLNAISKKATILDLGCGSGRFSINAARMGFNHITGVDITPEAIDMCKERATKEGLLNTEFIIGDMSELPFQDNSFDHVFCPRFSINALGTFARRKRAVQEMIRVARPGSKIYIESFNKLYLGKGPILVAKNISVDVCRYMRILYCKIMNKKYLSLLPGDIVYEANKVSTATKGYAHLPTIFELMKLTRGEGKIVFRSISEISGNNKVDYLKYFRYSIWIIIEKRLTE